MPANESNAARRERRRRKLAEINTERAEALGQRARARRDRSSLAKWIEQNVPGAVVDRSRSGRWYVRVG